MVIQFGHNDAEGSMASPSRTARSRWPYYEANLRRYIAEARAAGIKPVLCTPITRRYLRGRTARSTPT